MITDFTRHVQSDGHLSRLVSGNSVINQMFVFLFGRHKIQTPQTQDRQDLD